MIQEEEEYKKELEREDSDEEPKERRRRIDHLKKRKLETDAALRKFDQALKYADAVKDIQDQLEQEQGQHQFQIYTFKACRIIAETFKAQNQYDQGIKSFKFFMAKSYRLRDEATQRMEKMIKDAIVERKAQIADAVVRDWEKFDKNRVGMLSPG